MEGRRRVSRRSTSPVTSVESVSIDVLDVREALSQDLLKMKVNKIHIQRPNRCKLEEKETLIENIEREVRENRDEREERRSF